MYYTVTFNPSLDYIIFVDSFEYGSLNRARDEYIVPGGKGINVSIVLKNLGECNVLSEHNSKILVSKDGVVWFVENPAKKRQEDEYSYDSVICNGFTFNDVFKDVEPMYINILETLTKQYRIVEESAKMIVDAVIN